MTEEIRETVMKILSEYDLEKFRKPTAEQIARQIAYHQEWVASNRYIAAVSAITGLSLGALTYCYTYYLGGLSGAAFTRRRRWSSLEKWGYSLAGVSLFVAGVCAQSR